MTTSIVGMAWINDVYKADVRCQMYVLKDYHSTKLHKIPDYICNLYHLWIGE